MTVEPHESAASARTRANAPCGESHSKTRGAGHETAGGVRSRTDITTVDVLSLPSASMTCKVIRLEPSGRIAVTVLPLARSVWVGRPKSANHLKRTMSSFVPGRESGSLDDEPSRRTGVPAEEAHSTTVSALMTETGGWRPGKY